MYRQAVGAKCRFWTFVVLAGALVSVPRALLAQKMFTLSGDYVSVGPVLGATIEDGRAALLFGIESSLVRFESDGLWWGAYADALYDRNQSVRYTLGAELGLEFFGMDGGLLVNGDGDLGWVVRSLATIGVASAYYRLGSYFVDFSVFHEVGIIFKAPYEFGP